MAVGEGAVNQVGNDPIDKTFSGIETGGALVLAGGASMLGSIPFFISSGKNRRKAYLVIDNQSAFVPKLLIRKQTFISYGIRFNL